MGIDVILFVERGFPEEGVPQVNLEDVLEVFAMLPAYQNIAQCNGRKFQKWLDLLLPSFTVRSSGGFPPFR